MQMSGEWNEQYSFPTINVTGLDKENIKKKKFSHNFNIVFFINTLKQKIVL